MVRRTIVAVLTVWLSDRGADDCKAVSRRKCTQRHEDDNPQVEGINDMLASQANHLGESLSRWRRLDAPRRYCSLVSILLLLTLNH